MTGLNDGEEVQWAEGGVMKKGVIKNGVILEIKPTGKKKGSSEMAKKDRSKQAEALIAWREAHKNKEGKVEIPRRSNVAILAELKKKRATLVERLDKIDKKIRYFDSRVNALKRKELLAKLTTEQLEHIVERMSAISTSRPN